MKSNADCLRLRLVGLVIGMSWLSACGMVSFDNGGPAVCPPVVGYSRMEQQQAADEIASLQQNAVIVGWLIDYSVIRDQAQSCAR